MENNPLDQNDQGENETPQSPMRSALKGTLLGNFLDTGERRYMAAFILYLLAFVLFAGVIFYGVTLFTSGGVVKDGNHEFYGKLFSVVCAIGACISLGSFCGRRYSMGVQSGLATLFVVVLTYFRP